VFGYAFLSGYAFVIGYVSACQVVLPVKLFICVSRGKTEIMILNKTFLTAVALAAPLVISAGVLAPVQAAPISAGSKFSLSAFPGTQVSLTPSLVDFKGPDVTNNASTLVSLNAGATGTFSSLGATLLNSGFNLGALVRDVTLVGGVRTTPLGTFVRNLKVGSTAAVLASSASNLSFDLTSWQNTSATTALFQGVLNYGGDLSDAIGELVLTGSPTGSGYTMTITAVTAVPTPAALPALIGFGVGLVRKRKAAQLAEAAV
jgi:hypothetical protein